MLCCPPPIKRKYGSWLLIEDTVENENLYLENKNDLIPGLNALIAWVSINIFKPGKISIF